MGQRVGDILHSLLDRYQQAERNASAEACAFAASLASSPSRLLDFSETHIRAMLGGKRASLFLVLIGRAGSLTLLKLYDPVDTAAQQSFLAEKIGRILAMTQASAYAVAGMIRIVGADQTHPVALAPPPVAAVRADGNLMLLRAVAPPAARLALYEPVGDEPRDIRRVFEADGNRHGPPPSPLFANLHPDRPAAPIATVAAPVVVPPLRDWMPAGVTVH